MKKSLMIGAFGGYEWRQVMPWVLSVNRCGFQGDKIMIVTDASYDTVLKLFDHGFQVVVFERDETAKRVGHASPLKIHVERFLLIYNFLKDAWRDYDYVITTDVRDVIFQSDPVPWLRARLNGKKLVAAGESIRIGDEPWNRQNFIETYGPQLYELHKANEVCNVGVLAGEAEAVKDLCLNIFAAAVNRPVPITDQAALNALIHVSPYKDIFNFAGQAEDWTCQAGVMADPAKLAYFRPFLMAPEPRFENGVVKTASGALYCIVHQYDRVPEWNAHVMQHYREG